MQDRVQNKDAHALDTIVEVKIVAAFIVDVVQKKTNILQAAALRKRDIAVLVPILDPT
jgi:hypothetical protein